MSQPRNLADVKERFGAGADNLEFSELKDEKGIRIGIRPSGGKFLERSTWQSLNDIIRDMGGQYVKESKCWVVPITQGSLPQKQSIAPIATAMGQIPIADPNEKKYIIEELARVSETKPQDELTWMMVTVARAVLLLLEEKKP